MRFVLLLLVIAAIPLAAGETVVYAEWVHSGDSFTIDKPDFKNDIFTATYFVYDRGDDTQNKLLLKRNNRGISYQLKKDGKGNLVPDCKEDIFYRFCFESADWRWAKEKENPGHLEYRGGEEYPGLLVKIYQVGPDITVKRESGVGSSININEENKVTISLKNAGTERADPLAYTEFPPAWLNVLSSSGFTKDFTPGSPTFSWNSILVPDQLVLLSYRFKPLTYDTIPIPATLQYSYENQTFNKSVSTLTISVAKPYDFSLSLNPASTGVQGMTTITLTIKDLDKYRPLKGTVTLHIPVEVELFYQQLPVVKDGDYYTFSIDIPPKGQYVQPLSLRGLTTGSYNISAYADVAFPNEKFTAKTATVYRVEGTKVTSRIRFVGEEDKDIHGVVEAGKNFRVTADLQNLDKIQNIKDISGKISGPLLEAPIDVGLPVLAHEGTKTFADETLTAPITNNRKSYTFWFNGSFSSASDEVSSFSTFAMLAVEPSGGDYFQVTHDISDGIITKGKNVSVKVLVKNLKPYPAFKVDVKDTYTEGATLTAGTTKNLLDLDGQENKQAYLYRLDVPPAFNDSKVVITTHIAFQEYTIEKSSTITVNDPLPANETNTTLPADKNTTTPPPPEIPKPAPQPVVETAKEGGVSGFIDGVIRFFSRLFG